MGDQALLRYGTAEVRQAIRGWHSLDPRLPIKLDLARVYPWLGQELRTVWDLYSAGVPLSAVGRWWSLYLCRPRQLQDGARDTGDRAVNLLVKRVGQLLGYDLVPLPRN